MNYRFFGLFLLGLTAAILLRSVLEPFGPARYLFLVPNVLLAAVPLLVLPLFPAVRQSLPRPVAIPVLGFLAAVWLLFLPNAFYLLTDFMHLNPDVLVNAPGNTATYALEYTRGDALFLYDSLLLFSVTAFGAYAGGLALLQAYCFLSRRFSRPLAAGALAAVMLLSAVGVYIGRFGRWNSWEGLTQAHQIASSVWGDLASAQTRERLLIVVLVTLLFEILSLVFALERERSLRKG